MGLVVSQLMQSVQYGWIRQHFAGDVGRGVASKSEAAQQV